MSKKLSTTLTLAVTALKNLEERKGASPHDICNYISSVYNVPREVAKRKALVALKRGTSYGLLKENCGRYNLLTDSEKECTELTKQELGLLDLNCRKRRLDRKRRLRGGTKGKKSRGKSISSQKNPLKSSCGKGRRKKGKSKSRSRSRSGSRKKIKRGGSKGGNSTIKRGRSCVCPPGKSRRGGKIKARSTSSARKKRSKSKRPGCRKRSRKRKGKKKSKSANKSRSKSRSRSRSKCRSRSKSRSKKRGRSKSRSKSKSRKRGRSKSRSKSKSRKRGRSKSRSKSKCRKRGRSKSRSLSKRRAKKIKSSKKSGKKKRPTSCECPTNPARKIVPKSTGNDQKSDKPPKVRKEKKFKKEKKQKSPKKDKDNQQPKKDNCFLNFLGISSGN